MKVLIKDIANEILLWILDITTHWFGGKKQFLPSLENIENEDLKELAKKLNRDYNNETLTNILEWQEKNIFGWLDRWYMFLILYFLLVLSSFFLPIDPSKKTLFILFLVLIGLADFTIVLSTYLLLIGFILVLFSWIFFVNPMIAQMIFPVHFIVLLSVLFGAFIGLIIYLPHISQIKTITFYLFNPSLRTNFFEKTTIKTNSS